MLDQADQSPQGHQGCQGCLQKHQFFFKIQHCEEELFFPLEFLTTLDLLGIKSNIVRNSQKKIKSNIVRKNHA